MTTGQVRVIFPEHQFQVLVEAIREYHKGSGAGRNITPPPSDWSALANGKTMGKRVVVRWPGTHATLPTTIDILTIDGNNLNAAQMCLTLTPPKLIRNTLGPSFDGQNVQSMTGEMDNEQLVAIGPDVSIPQCTAIIDWGIGGVGNTVEADFSNGLCLNLSASFLRVRAKVEGNPDLDTTNGAIVLAAFVGPGVAKPNNAQRTIAIESNLGGEHSIPVPRYAKMAHLLQFATNVPVFTPVKSSGVLRFWANKDGVNAGALAIPIAQHFVDSDHPFPVVVPNEAYYFSFVDTTAGGPYNFSSAKVVFDLAV